MKKRESGIKYDEDFRKLTDEQRAAIERLIKNSNGPKKTLGHRMGEIFAALLVACVSALLIALTLKLISMILF